MTAEAEAPAISLDKWFPCLVLVAAVFAVYGNVYENALLFDDSIMIVNNDYLKSWHFLYPLLTKSTIAGSHAAGGFYRPVQMFLYFLIYQATGVESFGYHLLNVVLHAANASCVFLLGRALKFRPWAAFFATLIWAVHPLHTEVIAYATGTAEPLFVLFCLLGLLVMLPDMAPRRVVYAVPLFLLALLSKESAVVFPALAVTCIFLRDDKRLLPKTYLRTWPLWLIAVVYSIWRSTAAGFDGPQTYDTFYTQHGYDTLNIYAHNFSWRLYTFLATLPTYLALLVWPTGLHMERSFPAFVGLHSIQPWEGIAIILVAAMIMFVALTRHGKPRLLPLAWGLLWFAAAHFPNTGLIFPMNAQLLEHWMYLPAIGLFLGITETAATGLVYVESRVPLPKATTVAGFLALAAAAFLSLHTFEQNEVWRSPFTFYANIFKYSEVSPRAHNNLALAFADEGDYAAAIAEFEKAITISDTYAEIRYNLALALLQAPDQKTAIPAAIESLNRALELDPTFYRAWEQLANIHDAQGKKEKAAEERKIAERYYR